MFPKRLLALMLFTALAVLPSCVLRAQWVQTNGPRYQGFDTTEPVINMMAGVGHFIFVSSDSGIFVTSDSGVHWSKANQGLPDSNANALIADGTVLYVGTNSGVFLSFDSGQSWHQRSSGLSDPKVYSISGKGSLLFAGTQAGGIDRSTDSGMTWMHLKIPLASSGIVEKLASSDSVVYAVLDTMYTVFDTLFATKFSYNTAMDLFLSNDSGVTWKSILPGLGDYSAQGGDSSVLSIDASGNFVIASLKMYYMQTDYYWDLFFSSDRGQNWQRIWADPYNAGGVAAITLHDSTIFAQDEESVGGDNILYASLHDTTSQNIPWQFFESPQDILAILVANNKLWLADYGGTVWYLPLSDLSFSSDVHQGTSADDSIAVFPNPFTQSTQISFTSQSAGYAEVSIVNMLGVEVARLFSGELGAGEHTWLWGKPTGLPEMPDGTYECLVRMNGQVETLPVMLMRN